MKTSPYVAHVASADQALGNPEVPRLAHLDLVLTERCNNNCVHCCLSIPESDSGARTREMTAADIRTILEQAADLGALSVRFTGGEPLLREDFAEIYLSARGLGMVVTIQTNACLVTSQVADLLQTVPPLSPLDISVYGIRRDSYEAVARAKGSWARFNQGLRLLEARGVPFTLKMVPLTQKRDDVARLEEWAARFSGLQEPPAYVTELHLRYNRESESRNRAIARLRRPVEESLALMQSLAILRGHDWKANALSYCAGVAGPRGPALFLCGAGRAACVGPYGALYPCSAVRHPGMTKSLLTTPLGAALAIIADAVSNAVATDPEYLERCARCFIRGICPQCPGKSWAEHGRLDARVDYLCRAAQAEAYEIGILHPGECPWEVEDWESRILRAGGTPLVQSDPRLCSDIPRTPSSGT